MNHFVEGKIMKKLISNLTVLLFFCVLSSSVHSQSIQIVTEEFPPYNYEENGEITGVSTEVVKATLKELNIQPKISVRPWPRALREAQEKPNTLIYSIGRNAKRENLFKWVEVIAPADFYLFSLKDRDDIQINILDEAKAYKIGTVREDLREQYLISQGFVKGENVMPSNKYLSGFRKLLKDRIDLWAVPELTAYYLVKQEGYAPDKILRKVYLLDQISTEGYYMAFGKNTSDHIVEKFREALDTIKKNGTHQMILKKYLE